MGSVSGGCLNCEALAQSGPPRSNCAGMCACNAHCKLARGAIANDDFEVSFGLVMSAGVRCGFSSELQLFRLRAIIKGLQLLSLSSLYYLILSIRSSPMCLACLVFLVATLTPFGVKCMCLSGGPLCTGFWKWQHPFKTAVVTWCWIHAGNVVL